MVLYLLLLWLGAVALAYARQLLRTPPLRLIGTAVDWTLQGLYQDILFFLLPIYYASTTLTSQNSVALLFITAGAMFTSLDHVYRVATLRYWWTAPLLYGGTFFACLNVLFPLFGFPTRYVLFLSGALSVLTLMPTLRRQFRLSWRTTWPVAATLALVASFGAWNLRTFIPPVPLHLTRGTFSRSVHALEPVDPARYLSRADLRAWGGLACFTAVAAPAGLREPISHVWRKDGALKSVIRLTPIRGGRREGYRTFSRTTAMGPDPVGRWSVDVLTGSGQLLGRVRLSVTE